MHAYYMFKYFLLFILYAEDILFYINIFYNILFEKFEIKYDVSLYFIS